MSFEFLPDARYRMPVIFGPMPGPRQRVEGGRFQQSMTRVEMVTASFLTEAAHLERLLPAGFSLDGEPVVTIEYMFMTELRWLAGRGYNTLGVRFPVRYRGRSENLRGPFLAILWENMADPIISGREELGFSKLYCEIPPAQIIGDRRLYGAGWQGHAFLKMEVSDLAPATFAPEPDDGLLHYRYVPRTGFPGQSDVEGAVLTPSGMRVEILDYKEGKGSVTFLPSTWEQLPTLIHIVEKLAALPQLEERGAAITNAYFDNELINHRIVD